MAAKAKKRRQSAAEKFLTPLGFVWGHHYDSDERAIQIACSVRIELDRQRQVRKGGGFVEVPLNNCRAGCKGWDGHSEKCDCGRMEPYWVLAGGWELGSAVVKVHE
jgi:hypothetical protein